MKRIIVAILFMVFFLFGFHIKAAEFPTPPINETFDRLDPTLELLGATVFERNILLTLAIAEMAGTQDVIRACAQWGCDKGQSWSRWQIQCVNRPGGNWAANRWLWYLRIKMDDPKLTCNMLHDDLVGASAALIILRAFGKGDALNLMLMWGKSPDPHNRILLLRAIHAKIVKKRRTQ